jgi:hypothetical protein
MLVSVTVDGPTKAEPYGRIPHNLMFMDAGGRFSVSIVRDGIPKFESKNRTAGTDAENKASAQDRVAYFGACTISEPESSLTIKIEASNWPNFDGESQKLVRRLGRRRCGQANLEAREVETTAVPARIPSRLLWRRRGFL